ncbi:elongation factor Ts [Salsipaludibacter albus]|uniref:elongation factor Ts n=1 Tax=Salsipaludibacter albus TaxID=2849650 RepID=UPI001EE44AA9|nr:elongation factor Ts [Salsipaludibacter albus]MBY5164086.1 elongation factor Ts [Salsipaludibacter albus]
MAISAADVKKLRELTNAPMMACKKALDDADGDLDKAADLVRERTGAKMDARASERTASDGLVYTYAHTPTPGVPPKVGVMLQLSSETDFVAKNEKFQQLAHQLALHIAAMKPLVVREDQVDEEMVAKEREFARKEALEQGKPEHIVDKIVDGKVAKVYKEWVLLNQPFVMDDDRTVAEVISETQAILGEKIEVARFARFEVGN